MAQKMNIQIKILALLGLWIIPKDQTLATHRQAHTHSCTHKRKPKNCSACDPMWLRVRRRKVQQSGGWFPTRPVAEKVPSGSPWPTALSSNAASEHFSPTHNHSHTQKHTHTHTHGMESKKKHTHSLTLSLTHRIIRNYTQPHMTQKKTTDCVTHWTDPETTLLHSL